MGGTRKSKAILDNVKATACDRDNMRGLHFRSITSVYHLQTGNGAPIFVGVTNFVAERRVANFAI